MDQKISWITYSSLLVGSNQISTFQRHPHITNQIPTFQISTFQRHPNITNQISTFQEKKNRHPHSIFWKKTETEKKNWLGLPGGDGATTVANDDGVGIWEKCFGCW
ncbi:hypothetical protein CIPAW_07G063800 [Carya illinoinensis]|uniref:Uncharacterized protein n=1 Tax=Carya illinoinensis TaxID=32201 RepID=A0A8T1PZI5_CARIL|nr:hypothetical protein CIPAW_07G063800 [Carya illinoinensis]